MLPPCSKYGQRCHLPPSPSGDTSPAPTWQPPHFLGAFSDQSVREPTPQRQGAAPGGSWVCEHPASCSGLGPVSHDADAPRTGFILFTLSGKWPNAPPPRPHPILASISLPCSPLLSGVTSKITVHTWPAAQRQFLREAKWRHSLTSKTSSDADKRYSQAGPGGAWPLGLLQVRLNWLIETASSPGTGTQSRWLWWQCVRSRFGEPPKVVAWRGPRAAKVVRICTLYQCGLDEVMGCAPQSLTVTPLFLFRLHFPLLFLLACFRSQQEITCVCMPFDLC